MIEGSGAAFDPWLVGSAAIADATADARARLSGDASGGRAEVVKGTPLVKGAAAGVGMTSGGRLVGTSDGNRATSAWFGSVFATGDGGGEDAFALLALGVASGVSNAGALRRGAGSAGSTTGLTGSGARASSRAGATCAAEGSAGAVLGGPEMLMLGRATTAAEPWADTPAVLGALTPSGGALSLALEPNEKPDGAAR